MIKKFGKIISIVTVVPLFALYVNLILYFTKPVVFGGNAVWLLICLICLFAIPLCAYPVSYIVPRIHSEGRDGQRKLAFIFAIIGYVAGLIFCIAAKPPVGAAFILLTYFISGVALAVFNKFLHIKASGHACGVAAPALMLVIFLGAPALPALLVLPLVFWARISIKRHKLSELFTGTAVGVISLVIAYLIYYVI